MPLNSVYCCNIEHFGRVFDLKPGRKARKVLVFLDECSVCRQPRALIKLIDNNCQSKIITNRSGAKAINLYNKLSIMPLKARYSTKKGSKYNMCWTFYDGFWVKDFNGSKIFKFS